jgi:hypothetical protein
MDTAEYNEYCLKAKNMNDAMHRWADADPMSEERKKLWDNYCYLRDLFEEVKHRIEARNMH